MNEALILFAHGARDPRWAEPLRRVADHLYRLGCRVEIAFLEFLQPDLEACLETLIQEGAIKCVIVPMFFSSVGHVQRDLPERIALLQRRFPSIHLELAPAIGENEGVVTAMAVAAQAALKKK